MEVQGISPAKLQEVKDASIVQGQVDGSGNLVLTTSGGVDINAGSVVKPLFSWPIGSIYIGTASTNPAVLFGGGTWERFGKGRVLVGVDENDTQFDSPLEVGGAKTHTLSEAEMPSHSHAQAAHNHDGATGTESNFHTHGASASSEGAHSHGYTSPNNVVNIDEGGGGIGQVHQNILKDPINVQTNQSGQHVHTISVGANSQLHTHTIVSANPAIQATGGGGAHNNLQPFITVYMWRRTA